MVEKYFSGIKLDLSRRLIIFSYNDVNKIDKPGADADKVRRELSENDVLAESWGGKVQAVEISALNGDGINDIFADPLIDQHQ